MDEVAYEARKKSLEEQYRVQQQQRTDLKREQDARYDSQMAGLENKREHAHRDAYVRQQQMLNALPEQLAEYGITGGGAETSLLKIQTNYGKERSAIRNEYETAAGALQQEKNATDAAYKTGMLQDQSDYYDRLALLAQEIAEAQAAEEARAAEERLQQEKLAMEKYLQEEKLKTEERIAQAKLESAERIAQAKLDTSENPNDGTKNEENGETEEAEGETRKLEQIQIPTLTGTKTLTIISGQRIANEVKYDGSGKYYIVVDGEKKTPQEIAQGIAMGTLYKNPSVYGSFMYSTMPAKYMTMEKGKPVIFSQIGVLGQARTRSVIEMLRR